ncbi:MAG: ornithine cyclodeaminase family protein [Candidatus Dormibacteria bacterium]
MRWIPDEEVRRRLDMATAIRLVGEALHAHCLGAASISPRVAQEEGAGSLMMMPGRLPQVTGLKVLTIRPDNASRSRPTIQGVVLAFDPTTGQPRGALAGDSLTRIRTAAIAGYATKTLALPGADTLFLAGAGGKALDQVEAVLAVRPNRRVLLWNRTRARAEALAKSVAAAHTGLEVDVAGSLELARQAQVVTLVTASPEPLLRLGDVGAQCHINAMGSFQPHRREVASDLVAACEVYADTVAGCLEEAGDLLIPLAAGEIAREAIHELADARPGSGPRTLMKSVGSALFDLACAAWILDQA